MSNYTIIASYNSHDNVMWVSHLNVYVYVQTSILFWVLNHNKTSLLKQQKY